MDFILEHGWLILFFVWGLPLTYYRSKFRKLVYQTDHWVINIQPKFIKETKALFCLRCEFCQATQLLQVLFSDLSDPFCMLSLF